MDQLADELHQLIDGKFHSTTVQSSQKNSHTDEAHTSPPLISSSESAHDGSNDPVSGQPMRNAQEQGDREATSTRAVKGCVQFVSSEKPSYFELCVNCGEHRVSLGEINLQGVNNGGELFERVSEKYRAIRGFRIRHIFVKPVDIRFVYVCSTGAMKVHLRLC